MHGGFRRDESSCTGLIPRQNRQIHFGSTTGFAACSSETNGTCDKHAKPRVCSQNVPRREAPVQPVPNKRLVPVLYERDVVNAARDAYDRINREATNGVMRGALQANLRSVAASLEHRNLPIAAAAVYNAARRLDIYEAAAFEESS